MNKVKLSTAEVRVVKTPISYLEYQRLELIVPPKLEESGTIKVKLKRIWQLVRTTSRDSEPRVWYSRDRMGNTWWSALDPVTGRTINQVSESEMRSWIERRHH